MNMKKFLLSILCCLLACISIHAEEVTFNFKELYGSATTDATNKVVNGITISYAKNGSSNSPAFNKDGTLRLYYNASGNGGSATFTTDGTKKITSAVITAYSTSYTPAVKYSVDGGNLTPGTWSSKTMTISGISASNTLMIQNANTSNTQLRITKIVLTVESNSSGDLEEPETPVAPNAPTLTASCSFYNAMNVEITNIPDDATVYYTTDGTDPSASNGIKYVDPFEITETTTVKAVAVKDELDSEVVSATYTKIVVPQGEVIDVLTRELTGVTSGSTTYSSWTGKKSNSSAVYGGKSAGSNNAIQLRSRDGDEGIVTTVSGGKVKKIIVEWQGNTADGRTLNVYGKNGAYTDPTDLYDNTKYGDELGSIVKGTSTELEITGNYTYVGLRSNSGAMYITSITIIWENESNEPVSETWGSLYLPVAIDIPGDVKAYIVTGTGSDYVSLTQITGALPANTGIIYNGAWTPDFYAAVVNEEANVTGNLLKGSVADAYITEEAYVLAKVDGEVGFYKAQMNQNEGTAWLNNGFKAYLPANAVPEAVQGASGFKFRFETTGVEQVEVAKGVKAIYDLSGRKVNDMKAPGLYIVNGKKVLVK